MKWKILRVKELVMHAGRLTNIGMMLFLMVITIFLAIAAIALQQSNVNITQNLSRQVWDIGN